MIQVPCLISCIISVSFCSGSFCLHLCSGTSLEGGCAVNYVSRVFRISIQNFRKWKTDYRIWMIAIVVLLLIHSYMNEINRAAEVLQLPQTLWNYPFMYTGTYEKLQFTLPLLFIFCDAPFLDSNQLFVTIRSGKTQWCLGQVLYIVMTSAVYYLFLIAATILLSLPKAEWSLG